MFKLLKLKQIQDNHMVLSNSKITQNFCLVDEFCLEF